MYYFVHTLFTSEKLDIFAFRPYTIFKMILLTATAVISFVLSNILYYLFVYVFCLLCFERVGRSR